jgi:glycosyltransferase involved in cell wall biosynthesis
MKKLLVVDWLDKYGGAERVIKSLNNIFDFDYCSTMINIMDEKDLNKIFHNKNINIKTTLLQYFGNKFRFLLPLFPYFIKSIKVEDDVSLIISSSHAVAKYVSSKNVLHISYFQARNLKYIWEEQGLYFSGIKKIFKVFVPYLQKFDLEASKKPDYIVANSKFVQKWIKDTYYRESTVIYPPVDVDGFDFIENKDDYYVTVGRLEPYKRFDIIVDAFNELNDKKLIVIGDGSQRKVLQKKSGGNITFTGFLEKSEVNKYISKAKCFIFAGIEDFGIASVEAQACGTPVICLNQAGTAETSIDGITGIHFMEQNFESLLEAVEKFEKNSDSFEPKKIRANALRFSKERFEKEIKEFVEEKYEIFKKERN